MCKFCEEQGLGTDPLSENRKCSFKHEKAPYGSSRHTGPIVFFRLLFFGSVPFRNELHQLVVFLIGFLKLAAQ